MLNCFGGSTNGTTGIGEEVVPHDGSIALRINRIIPLNITCKIYKINVSDMFCISISFAEYVQHTVVEYRMTP